MKKDSLNAIIAILVLSLVIIVDLTIVQRHPNTNVHEWTDDNNCKLVYVGASARTFAKKTITNETTFLQLLEEYHPEEIWFDVTAGYIYWFKYNSMNYILHRWDDV